MRPEVLLLALLKHVVFVRKKRQAISYQRLDAAENCPGDELPRGKEFIFLRMPVYLRLEQIEDLLQSLILGLKVDLPHSHAAHS